MANHINLHPEQNYILKKIGLTFEKLFKGSYSQFTDKASKVFIRS